MRMHRGQGLNFVKVKFGSPKQDFDIQHLFNFNFKKKIIDEIQVTGNICCYKQIYKNYV